MESQMKAIARPMYSNPPLHGALLVSLILHDAGLKQQWYQVSASARASAGCLPRPSDRQVPARPMVTAFRRKNECNHDA